MSTLGGILSTARSSLFAHQTAVSITSHNIANAETEGYSRQTVQLSPGYPIRRPFGMLGSGVQIDDIARSRDALLDATYRRESGKSASYELQNNILSQIEDVFGEPSETGISAAMDRFWSAWSDLSSDPTNASARLMVQQRGAQLVSGINSASARLAEVDDSVRLGLANGIKEINLLTSQIAEINVQIVSAESGGITANDLRDTRDRLLDSLSKLANVNATERTDGAVAVTLGNVTIVDASSSTELRPPTNLHGEWAITTAAGTRIPVSSENGEIGGMLHLLNTELPDVVSKLDTLARELVSTVNEIHRQGWSQAGEAAGLGSPNWDATDPPTGSGINFFDEGADLSSVTAATLSLSLEVSGNAQVIATGFAQGETADNELALQMANLRSAKSIDGEISFNDYYRDAVTSVGLKASAAKNSAAVFGTLSVQAENRRLSVSGVSVDEELVRLIQYQQGYTAASRLITVVDEMIETILHM